MFAQPEVKPVCSHAELSE